MKSPKHLVLPLKVAGRFVTRSGDDNWMLFPFVGPIEGVGAVGSRFSPAEILATARQVAVELNAVSQSTIAALKNHGLVLHLSSYKGFSPEFLERIFEIPGLRSIYETALTYPAKSTDQLIHQDLHSGNMIRDGQIIRVIDLESMQLGTICTDLVKAAIWCNCSPEQIGTEIEALEERLCRQVQPTEYAYGVALWLSWFAEALAQGERVVIGRYATGLSGAASYFHNRWR